MQDIQKIWGGADDPEYRPGNCFPDSLIVPDFDEKITFNNLSCVVNHQLVMGSYQENLLTQYFNENPGIKEVLQKKFHALYEQAKKDIPESKEHYADSRFFLYSGARMR